MTMICSHCKKKEKDWYAGQRCQVCEKGIFCLPASEDPIAKILKGLNPTHFMSRELFPEHKRYRQYIELPEIRTHNKTKKITREIATLLFDYDNTKLTWKIPPHETKAIITILNKDYSALEIVYLIKTGQTCKRWNSVTPIDGDWENTSYENIKEP